MEQFKFLPHKKTGYCKLSEHWRIYESLRYYRFQKDLKDFANNPKPEVAKKTAKKIISLTKKIMKETVSEDDFDKLFKRLKEFFFHKKTILNNSITSCLMECYLGPLDFLNARIYYNIDDFQEVYLQGPDNKMKDREFAYGLIKSKTCGWIGWMLVRGDKALSKSLTSKYMYLISMNHFKMETARDELFTKYRKYNAEVLQRGLKRFFIGSRFWFHDDLENLKNSLRPVILDDYSQIMGAFMVHQD